MKLVGLRINVDQRGFFPKAFCGWHCCFGDLSGVVVVARTCDCPWGERRDSSTAWLAQVWPVLPIQPSTRMAFPQ